MRDYGKVHTTFWSSSTMRKLSEDGRTLALYLLTSPHSTIAGVYRLPDGYVCEDLQWPSERVAKGFAELLSNGFANRCETTKWVWICKHLDWNQPENPNQRKSALKVALSIPDECGWKLDFMRVCGPLLGADDAENTNPSETVPKGLANQKQKQEQKQEKEKKARDPATSQILEDLFNRFWAAYPKKAGKDAARTAFAKRKPDEALLGQMLAAIDGQKATEQWQRDGGQYIPHPATWLNQGRFDDELQPQHGAGGTGSSVGSYV
jgi:hypothetical protein